MIVVVVVVVLVLLLLVVVVVVVEVVVEVVAEAAGKVACHASYIRHLNEGRFSMETHPPNTLECNDNQTKKINPFKTRIHS